VGLNGEPQVKSYTRCIGVLTGKRENTIQNLKWRTPSIIDYQTSRATYMMIKNLYSRIMGRPIPVKEVRQENYHFS
jgi:hypothetical protein